MPRKYHNMRFNSLAELAETAALRGGMTDEEAGGYSSSQRSPRDHFFGPMSFPRALETVHTGGYWPKGAERMQTSSAQITAAPPAPRKRPRPGVAGYRPSVPRYLAGTPAHMMRGAVQPDPSRRVVRLGVQLARAAMVEPNEAINQGAAILALIKRLESEGTQVEVTGLMRVASTDDPDHHGLNIEVRLKSTSEFISPADCAFLFCHAAMTRRIFWAVAETCEEGRRGIGRCYGNATDSKGIDYSDFDYHLPYLAHRHRECSTPEGADRYVRSIIEKQDKARQHRAA